MELALLCGLVVMAGVIPIQGGILNLNKMVKQVTGKTPFLSYWPYGCHCGLGGRGQPKDASDWCCRTHDCCYAHLKTHGCRFHTDHYRYNFSQGEIYCCEYPDLRVGAGDPGRAFWPHCLHSTATRPLFFLHGPTGCSWTVKRQEWVWGYGEGPWED
nr:group IID secretory phospholipase A2-like isoform X1 [Aotus nancymaae]